MGGGSLALFDKTRLVGTSAAASLYWGRFLFNSQYEVLSEVPIVGKETRKDTPMPKDPMAGAVQVLNTGWVLTGLFADKEPRGWSLRPRDGVNIPYPKFLSGCVQADAFCTPIALFRNGQGKVFAADCNPVYNAVSPIAHPPHALPAAIRVRGGCSYKDRKTSSGLCAAQMLDGTWRAWGDAGDLTEKVNSLGQAVDLDATASSSTSGFLVWIEPVKGL